MQKIHFEKYKVFTHSAASEVFLSKQNTPPFWDISIALSNMIVKYIFSYILSEVLIHFSLQHLSMKVASLIVHHELSVSSLIPTLHSVSASATEEPEMQ